MVSTTIRDRRLSSKYLQDARAATEKVNVTCFDSYTRIRPWLGFILHIVASISHHDNNYNPVSTLLGHVVLLPREVSVSIITYSGLLLNESFVGQFTRAVPSSLHQVS